MASLGALGRANPTQEAASSPSTAFVGFVHGPDGLPAAGAVVVSSAGGKAVTDGSGGYRLEVRVPLDAQSVQITALGAAGGNLAASRSVGVTASLVQVGRLSLAPGGTCLPSWLPTFGGQFLAGVDEVTALAVYDDGSGPELYAGFQFPGGFGTCSAEGILKWDGHAWATLGSGVDQTILAMAVYDDGNGPALYVGGRLSTAGGLSASRLARWNGSSWAPLGSGVNGDVRALTVSDNGGGPALYASGDFTVAGGGSANHIAKWDGSSWTPLGSGLDDTARALAVFDDGGGPALHVGGDFLNAGGVSASRIAKWNGTSWSALGSGLDGMARALIEFDDGGGSRLYVGGSFVLAGGVSANRIARWDGSIWSALGSGANAPVRVLAVHEDGGGRALYAGGTFTTMGGVAAGRTAKWNGSNWMAVESGMDGAVQAAAVYDDGSGSKLYVGGEFAGKAARWDGSSWAQLERGVNGSVSDLVPFDDGSGTALHATGAFTAAGGQLADSVARWDGSSWMALGGGVDASFLEVYDDGDGPALHAGGSEVWKWDGSSWVAISADAAGSQVHAMAVFDDGSGPALFVGGNLPTVGGVATNGIAKWDGQSWSALGSGVSGPGHIVSALTVYDDGSGPALFVGGDFTNAGGVVVNRIAKWNGSSWAALGSGFTGFLDRVLTLAVHDDGSGPALFVGGRIGVAGGMPVQGIAKWNGSGWAALGSGVSGLNSHVRTLTVHDDGGGPALVVGGAFSSAGGMAANGIAKWDGSSWATFPSAFSGSVSSLEVYDDGGGPALFVGGNFWSFDCEADRYLAKWGCDTTPPELVCPASVSVLDRIGSPPGEVVTFPVSVAENGSLSPSLVCTPASGSVFPRGTTLVTCTATDAYGNESTCQFPVTVAPKIRRR